MPDKLSILLSFLIGFFAIGSWIDLNGLWVEVPLLINNLPEGPQLPTYVVAIVQLGNIAPLIYMGVHCIKKFRNIERFTIYLIFSIGCICCALLSVFWNHTLKIHTLGIWRQSSLPFFILIWLLSVVDTTSSVTFLPYLINYPRHFITALYVGEGLSGFIPGIVGLIQGIGGEPYCANKTIFNNGTSYNSTSSKVYPPPRFSISIFFLFLFVMLVMCLVSFSLVDNCRCFRKYQLEPNQIDIVSSATITENSSDREIEIFSSKEKLPVFSASEGQSNKKWIFYILLVAYINFFTNGALPSIQNYSLMPYGIVLYHVIVNISQILNPLACLLTLYPWRVTIWSVIIMTTFGSLGVAYIILAACKSPLPIINSYPIGDIIISLCWFLVSILFSFEKTLLALELQKQGHVWLQLCGVMTQVGSTLGSIVIFILVVILNTFHSKQIIC